MTSRRERLGKLDWRAPDGVMGRGRESATPAGHGLPRVLRVVARLNVGGPAKQIVNLERGLDARGYETRVVAGVVEEGEQDYLTLDGIDLDTVSAASLRRSPRLTGDLAAYLAIKREIIGFRPHIVHTHTAKAGVLGRQAAIACGVPTIVHTFHGHLLEGYFRGPVSRLITGAERYLARRTTVLCTVGDQVRRELLAAGVGTPPQFRVVPPGLDVPDSVDKQLARQQLGLPLRAPVVGYVGRLAKVKRMDRLINMATVVHGRLPTTHFIVAGGGDQLEWTRAAAASSELPFHFLGWTRDIAVVYAAADVTVLVSDNEGMPTSLIESAMVGTPAVTTDVGSAGEVVLDGRTGFVRPRDPVALGDAVLDLLTNADLRERLGAAAQRHAHQAFSAGRLVDDMHRIYTGLDAHVR